MLQPGESTEVKGSGAKPYVIKNVDGFIWTCSCPGWKNCSGAVNKKTCKHVRLVHGDVAEANRIGSTTVQSNNTTSTSRMISSNANVNVANVPRSEDEYIQSILDRAAAEGRALRPDEKAKVYGPPVLLANSFDWKQNDPTGWLMSEKLDGVRCLLKGGKFISRQGNEYEAPDWFKDDIKDLVLDGELYLDRSEFAKTISIVKSKNSGDLWKKIYFRVFDAPEVNEIFEERIKYCKNSLINAKYASVLDQFPCEGVNHLKNELKRIESIGGEGIMLRQPGSLYESGKSNTLLKVKSFFDSEARVIGYLPGKGKFKGMLGSLRMETSTNTELKIGGKSCILKVNTKFEIGTGISNEIRLNPPPIGSTVTFSFQELSKDGVPRFPVFIAIRNYE